MTWRRGDCLGGSRWGTESPAANEGSIGSSVKLMTMDGKWTRGPGLPLSLACRFLPRTNSDVPLAQSHPGHPLWVSLSPQLFCHLCHIPPLATYPSVFLFIACWHLASWGWMSLVYSAQTPCLSEWMSLTPLCLSFRICRKWKKWQQVGQYNNPGEGLGGSGWGFRGDPQPWEKTSILAQRAKWLTQTTGRKATWVLWEKPLLSDPKDDLKGGQFHVDMGVTFRFFLNALQEIVLKKIAVVQLFWTWIKQEMIGRDNRYFL